MGVERAVTLRAFGAPPGAAWSDEEAYGAGGGSSRPLPPRAAPDIDLVAEGPGRASRARSLGPDAALSPQRRGAQLVVPAVPRGVPLSRQLVREICKLLDLEELADVAELLASEVVTNAVLHAATGSLEVAIEVKDDRLVVSVADEDSRPPTMRQPTIESTGGRGLYLLDSLAERWGVTEWPQGKAVWFTLSTRLGAHPGPSGRARQPARAPSSASAGQPVQPDQ